MVELTELAATLARIDERTKAMKAQQTIMVEVFKGHEDNDRTDFKEVNGRIGKLERKQNWILGVGSACAFAVTLVLGAINGLFGS